MTSTSVAVQAFAKINIHLSVLRPRSDGFHDLASLFQLISLHDSLTVSVMPSCEFSCSVTGLEFVALHGEDTMHRAARLWHEAAGMKHEVRIDCVKRIPTQAGLGGGSSDAASVLMALDQLAGDHALGLERLLCIALEIGSDVPFFLCGAGAAWAHGRGEVLEPVAVPDGYQVLVVMPLGFSNSTSKAFEKLDSLRVDEGMDNDGIASLSCGDIQRLYQLSCADWPFFNDFSYAVGHDGWYGRLDTLQKRFPQTYGLMSGSGAAWYAVSKNESALAVLERVIRDEFSQDAGFYHANFLCNHLYGDTLQKLL